MSLFELEGTLTAIGQNVFSNDGVLYAYLEVTAGDGRRTLIEKVGVCNDVGSQLAVGISGRFYVDRFFRSGPLRSQLWGLKTDRVSIVDDTDLRKTIAAAQIMKGIPAILIFGLGLFLIASGIGLLVQSARYNRNNFFWGGVVARRLPDRHGAGMIPWLIAGSAIISGGTVSASDAVIHTAVHGSRCGNCSTGHPTKSICSGPMGYGPMGYSIGILDDGNSAASAVRPQGRSGRSAHVWGGSGVRHRYTPLASE